MGLNVSRKTAKKKAVRCKNLTASRKKGNLLILFLSKLRHFVSFLVNR